MAIYNLGTVSSYPLHTVLLRLSEHRIKAQRTARAYLSLGPTLITHQCPETQIKGVCSAQMRGKGRERYSVLGQLNHRQARSRIECK
jgi:hypothetical protein